MRKNVFDDIGERWLKEHDPDYGKQKNTYLTSQRLDKVWRKEIPLSSFKGDAFEYINEAGNNR
jgi:hypothetical protein